MGRHTIAVRAVEEGCMLRVCLALAAPLLALVLSPTGLSRPAEAFRGSLSSHSAVLAGSATAIQGRSIAGQPASGRRNPRDGRWIFRYDTFGDEQLWTDVLRMHEVVPRIVSPALALKVGLKVDLEALPSSLVEALVAKQVDLTDPAVTVTLLGLDAVVGLRGTVNDGRLERLGITCALCHSTVDDALVPGIGRRLDGWANVDLNVGAIVSLSPAIDKDTIVEFSKWGPGKYDPRHHVFGRE
jgi:hypothetical protein